MAPAAQIYGYVPRFIFLSSPASVLREKTSLGLQVENGGWCLAAQHVQFEIGSRVVSGNDAVRAECLPHGGLRKVGMVVFVAQMA